MMRLVVCVVREGTATTSSTKVDTRLNGWEREGEGEGGRARQ